MMEGLIPRGSERYEGEVEEKHQRCMRQCWWRLLRRADPLYKQNAERERLTSMLPRLTLQRWVPLVLHTAITHFYPALWLQRLLQQKHITASMVGALTKACTEVSKLFHNGTLLWTQMCTGFTATLRALAQQPCASPLGFSPDMLFCSFTTIRCPWRVFHSYMFA